MESPFVCDMTALTSDERARHRELAGRLVAAVAGLEELADGYAARFAMEPTTVLALAEFITLERLCCPWLTLAVEVERERGPLRLRITGREGAKPYIRAEFGIGTC